MSKKKITLEYLANSIDDLANMMGKQFNDLKQEMDKRFDKVDKRFDKVDDRLSSVEKDVSVLKEDMVVVKADLLQVKKGQKSLLCYMEILGDNMSDLLRDQKKNVSYGTFKGLEDRVVKLEVVMEEERD